MNEHAPLVLTRRELALGMGVASLGLPARALAQAKPGPFYDVRRFGARGDGKRLDSDAINRAIEAAHRAGGGTVVVPAGRYLCFSIRLKDRVTLFLADGSVIEGADPAKHRGGYDHAENDQEEQFQDFGITHIHTSLIYGNGVVDAGIEGPGLIHGLGLRRDGPGARWHGVAGWQSPKSLGLSPHEARLRDPKEAAMIGQGNRAIGFRNCRNLLLRDFKVLQGGHFAVYLIGCSNAVLDGLTIDTGRDGIDVDCCRDVRVVNCIVNAPKDDAIVIKSSYALGRKVWSENIAVRGCKTSGYPMGTLLDGSYEPWEELPVGAPGPVGRIKLGTESNGGFRNIAISDCVCENSSGISMGSIDGGTLEDVTVSDIMLRGVINVPLFVRLSARMRAPEGTPVGIVRRVRFSNITVSHAASRFPCAVVGIADAYPEDISFTGIRVQTRGGRPESDGVIQPTYNRTATLTPGNLGPLPALGFYARHARRITLRDFQVAVDEPDGRSAIVLDSVDGAVIDDLRAPVSAARPVVSRESQNVAVGAVTRG